MKIPKKYTDLIGKHVELEGIIFPNSVSYNRTMFYCQGLFLTGRAFENREKTVKLAAYQLALRSEHMSEFQWSTPFPIKELNLKNEMALNYITNGVIPTIDELLDEKNRMMRNQSYSNELLEAEKDTINYLLELSK